LANSKDFKKGPRTSWTQGASKGRQKGGWAPETDELREEVGGQVANGKKSGQHREKAPKKIFWGMNEPCDLDATDYRLPKMGGEGGGNFLSHTGGEGIGQMLKPGKLGRKTAAAPHRSKTYRQRERFGGFYRVKNPG